MPREILFFPMHDWRKCLRETFRTRDAHWMKELVRREDVGRLLVVNRPRSLPERLRDLRRGDPMRDERPSSLALRTPGARLFEPDSKTVVLDLDLPDAIGPIRYGRNWWRHALIAQRAVGAVREALAALGMTRPTLWLQTPFAAGELLDAFPEASATLFDGLDDWLDHPDFGDPFGYIAEGYRSVAERCDALTANSEGLAARLNAMRGAGRTPAVFVGNGVDVEFFRPSPPPVEPPELRAIGRPRIGFFGKFSAKVDAPLLADVARRSPPEWEFLLAGQEFAPANVRELREVPRFRRLGDLPYDRLPAFLAHVDVGVIPYRPEKAARMHPLKFYEYLAAGLPLVTTPIEGIMPDWPGVRIASDVEGFLAAIRESLAFPTEARARLHESIPEDFAWRRRLDAVFRNLDRSAGA